MDSRARLKGKPSPRRKSRSASLVLALLVTTAFAAMTASSAVASGSFQQELLTWYIAPSPGTKLKAAEAVKITPVGTTTVHTTIAGTAYEFSASGVECANCTIENQTANGKAYFHGELRFTGTKLIEPSFCSTSTTIVTRPLTGTIGKIGNRSVAAMQLEPTAGSGELFSIEVFGCVLEGVKSFFGSQFTQFANALGVAAKTQQMEFSHGIQEALGTSATTYITGALNLSLGSGAEFDVGSNRPTVETGSPWETGYSKATVPGTVNPSGFATKDYFEYGPTEAYGSKTPEVSAGSGFSVASVLQEITGVVEGTTYHYRMVATNANGTSYGKDRTFTPNRSQLTKELTSLPLINQFDGSAESLANFSSSWDKLGGTTNKGEDTSLGWLSNPVHGSSGIAYKSSIVSNGHGTAVEVTLPALPVLESNDVSLYLDMASAAANTGYSLVINSSETKYHWLYLEQEQSGALLRINEVEVAPGAEVALIDEGSKVVVALSRGAGYNFEKWMQKEDSAFSGGESGVRVDGGQPHVTRFRTGAL